MVRVDNGSEALYTWVSLNRTEMIMEFFLFGLLFVLAIFAGGWSCYKIEGHNAIARDKYGAGE